MLPRIVALVVLAAGLVAFSPPAWAAGTTPSAIALSAPPTAAGDPVSLSVALTSEGAPLGNARVRLERRTGGVWAALAEAVTAPDGRAQVAPPMSTEAGDNTFRATYDGDETRAPAVSGDLAVALVQRASTVNLTAADSVVEFRETSVSVRWLAANGAPVAGEVVLSEAVGKRWTEVTRRRTGADGRASVDVDPLDDVRYRVEAPALAWVAGARSSVARIAVRPSGRPVRLPRASPRPRVRLPAQPHAVGEGANPVVTPIPDGVWDDMTGRSWHCGCPVGRAGLRLVRVNYWDYDGFRRRGELVVATSVAAAMSGAVAAMYDAQLPIRSMYRVDRFGWSARLQGADDYRSMAAGNTSAFNCRNVVNRPGVRSPHASGRSLDVNPWENPYRSATGLVPNTWWQSRSDPRVAWRSRSHPVVRLMARQGLRWTYGVGDTQHFDAVGARGRIAVPQGCRQVHCD